MRRLRKSPWLLRVLQQQERVRVQPWEREQQVLAQRRVQVQEQEQQRLVRVRRWRHHKLRRQSLVSTPHRASIDRWNSSTRRPWNCASCGSLARQPRRRRQQS